MVVNWKCCEPVVIYLYHTGLSRPLRITEREKEEKEESHWRGVDRLSEEEEEG